MKRLPLVLLAVLALGVVGTIVVHRYLRELWYPVLGRHTVATRLASLRPDVDARLAPQFAARGVPYPPSQLALVAFKAERRVELWAGTPLTFIADYDVKAASGGPGPKLLEGDRQVPEGIYKLSGLNPNSQFHVSLKVDYPNAFDRANATADGRSKVGGDIFIHGKAASIGCLAMGDAAAEELFVLGALVGQARTEIIIFPSDFRGAATPAPPPGSPPWVAQLYADLAKELVRFPR